jgi:hypothetical protein
MQATRLGNVSDKTTRMCWAAYSSVLSKHFIDWSSLSIHFSFEIRIRYFDKQRSVVDDVLTQNNTGMGLQRVSTRGPYSNITTTHHTLLDVAHLDSGDGQPVSCVHIERILSWE